jgi:hypothetical protein
MHYKPLTIINDDSRVVNKLEASLTDDARVVIYDRHMFIVQVIGLVSAGRPTVLIIILSVRIPCLKQFKIKTKYTHTGQKVQTENVFLFLCISIRCLIV